ncbi:hypothetical protein [Leucobacter aridicollis]|uniref:hypothetical protein n=1 Tax=Leucobacter aridicollis TaxID=283878 RepID=UPI000E64C172|nr:hypothetical protein [Leucobacter aridicollis]UTX54595.1 hypothetical protein KI794_08075 [Leucobacter aridicollis]
MNARATLAQNIIDQRFRLSRYGGRYNLDDVDRLLDALASQVVAGGNGSELARSAIKSTFRVVPWFREGYLVDDVDDFIDVVVRRLRALPDVEEDNNPGL